MYLKRLYDDAGRVTSVEIRHTGVSAEQNFSRRMVLQACSDGWMRLAGDHLIVVGEPEDLVYTIKRAPGYYCVSTGERIQVSQLAWEQAVSQPAAVLASAEARAWLAGAAKAANDYEVTMAYECVLAERQHGKFRAVKAVSGNLVAAHTLEA